MKNHTEPGWAEGFRRMYPDATFHYVIPHLLDVHWEITYTDSTGGKVTRAFRDYAGGPEREDT